MAAAARPPAAVRFSSWRRRRGGGRGRLPVPSRPVPSRPVPSRPPHEEDAYGFDDDGDAIMVMPRGVCVGGRTLGRRGGPGARGGSPPRRSPASCAPMSVSQSRGDKWRRRLPGTSCVRTQWRGGPHVRSLIWERKRSIGERRESRFGPEGDGHPQGSVPPAGETFSKAVQIRAKLGNAG